MSLWLGFGFFLEFSLFFFLVQSAYYMNQQCGRGSISFSFHQQLASEERIWSWALGQSEKGFIKLYPVYVDMIEERSCNGGSAGVCASFSGRSALHQGSKNSFSSNMKVICSPPTSLSYLVSLALCAAIADTASLGQASSIFVISDFDPRLGLRGIPTALE